jgi:glucokinase
MAPPERRFLVVGDLGGTNGRLSLRDASDGAQVTRRDYLIAMYAKLDDMLRQFMEDTATPASAVSSAVLAVCGPVTERGRWNLHNNSHWIAAPNRAGDIEAGLGLAPQTLLFLNDFEANGYALTALFPVGGGASSAAGAAAPQGLLTLHAAPADAAAPFACVGAGTGLGCVFGVPHVDPLTGSPRGYTVCPSEAGMANSICPSSEAEWGLLRYLQARYATPHGSVHVDVERIVSGPGLVDCYRYHGGAAGGGEGDDDSVTPEAVAERARAGGDAPAAAAVSDFLTFYGRVLSTAACGFLPYAGLFIAGGILPKLRWAWTRAPAGSADPSAWEVDPDCSLLRAYRDAGPKMAPLVAAVPLVLVDDADIGLKGCLAVAAQRAAAAAAAAASAAKA